MFSPDIAVILYRGPFLIIFYIGLLAINLAVWTRARVNYIRIFQLKPGRRPLPWDLLRISFCLMLLWMFFIVALYSHSYFNFTFIDPFTIPFIFLCTLVAILFNPFNMMYRSCRAWILRTIWRIICAPFYDVRFADFWLGDQLVSMSQVLKDFEFSSCFFITKFSDGVATVPDASSCMSSVGLPYLLVGALPSWWRAAQCLRRYCDTGDALPHLANTLKYSFGLADVALVYLRSYCSTDNVMFDYIWFAYVANKTIKTLYSFYWDIVMDWGLVTLKFGFIPVWSRARMLYKYRSIYILAMIEDFILRFSWLYALVLKQYLLLPDQSIATILATLEIIRRIVWNCFRVENEHVNNCGEFREVCELPLLLPEDIAELSVPASCKKREKFFSFDFGNKGDETEPLLKSQPMRNTPTKTYKNEKCYSTVNPSVTVQATANPWQYSSPVCVV